MTALDGMKQQDIQDHSWTCKKKKKRERKECMVVTQRPEIVKLAITPGRGGHILPTKSEGACIQAQHIYADMPLGALQENKGKDHSIWLVNGMTYYIRNLNQVLGEDGFTRDDEWFLFKSKIVRYDANDIAVPANGIPTSLFLYRKEPGPATIRGLLTHKDPERVGVYLSHIKNNTLLRKHQFYSMICQTPWMEFTEFLRGEVCQCSHCKDAGKFARREEC